MKLLYIIPGFYRVGDYMRCVRFAEGMAARGHSVSLLIGDRRFRASFAREIHNNVEMIYVPYWGGLGLAEWLFEAQPDTKLPLDILFRSLWIAKNAGQFDLVHVFHIGASSLIPFIVSQAVVPGGVCIQDWCDKWADGILRPARGLLDRLDYHFSGAVERWSIRIAKFVTVNSDYLASLTISAYARRCRVLKIIEGADLDLITPRPKITCRKSLGFDQDLRWLGFAAFFNPDSELLIETIKCMLKLLGSAFRVLWMGPVDGELAAQIEKSGVDPVVVRVGAVPREKMHLYLGACDAFLMPFSERLVNLSRWPAKFGDYLAAGRPVISNPTGEVARFFRIHPEIGILARAEPEAFARAACDLLSNDQMLEVKGLAARRAAEIDLSWSAAVIQMEDFYHELAAQYSSAAIG